MSSTITVRLSEELDAWLRATAEARGVSRGFLIREQLDQAKTRALSKSFTRLAGTVDGARDLSAREDPPRG